MRRHDDNGDRIGSSSAAELCDERVRPPLERSRRLARAWPYLHPPRSLRIFLRTHHPVESTFRAALLRRPVQALPTEQAIAELPPRPPSSSSRQRRGKGSRLLEDQ